MGTFNKHKPRRETITYGNLEQTKGSTTSWWIGLSQEEFYKEAKAIADDKRTKWEGPLTPGLWVP